MDDYARCLLAETERQFSLYTKAQIEEVAAVYQFQGNGTGLIARAVYSQAYAVLQERRRWVVK
jgi:hypothetical protein